MRGLFSVYPFMLPFFSLPLTALTELLHFTHPLIPSSRSLAFASFHPISLSSPPLECFGLIHNARARDDHLHKIFPSCIHFMRSSTDIKYFVLFTFYETEDDEPLLYELRCGSMIFSPLYILRPALTWLLVIQVSRDGLRKGWGELGIFKTDREIRIVGHSVTESHFYPYVITTKTYDSHRIETGIGGQSNHNWCLYRRLNVGGRQTGEAWSDVGAVRAKGREREREKIEWCGAAQVGGDRISRDWAKR